MKLNTEKIIRTLRPTWVRVLVSFFGGGFIVEFVHVTTGPPNRPVEHNYSFLIGILLYFSLTYLINKHDQSKR